MFLTNLTIILAVLIGYYLGSRNQFKEDGRKIKKKITAFLSRSPQIKVFSKTEPKSEIRKQLEELEAKMTEPPKNNA